MNYSECRSFSPDLRRQSAESDREKVRKDKSNTHAVRYTRAQNTNKEEDKPQLGGTQSGKERAERKKEPCRGLVQCTPPRRRLSASWS